VTAAGVLTFAPGETSKQVPVTVLGDATDEAATESFSVSLANAVNARLVSSTATGFIVDDDPTPSPSTFVNVSDATVTEGNSGMVNATFTVSLTAPSLATVTVPYSTSDSTAQAPPDYVAQNGTLSFAPGQTSKAVTVAVKGDTVDENDEQFSFSLGSPVNATLLRATAFGTIVDNDTTARAWISDATVVEGNTGAAVAHFAVTLSAPSTAPVAIDWSTSDSSAVAPGDYVDDFDTLVFNPGQTTQTVDITVNPDTLAESTEAFSVNLNNAINALLTDSTGVGTILDMDTFVLSGKVTDGAGTALANVVVTRVGNKLPSASTKTDNTGTFSFEVPDGVYNLQPALAGYTFLPSAWNGVLVRGGSVTSSAFLAVHGVAITGRVLTTANAASAGVRIVRDANATQPQATVFTNPQGYYALSDTPAGSYGLSATNTTTDLFSPISTTVNVGAASVNGVDFINAFTPAIQGRVIDANGAGVAGVTITRTGNGQPAVTFTTNDLGYWALSDNVPTQAGTQYVITPTRAGLTFSPASKSVTVLQFSWPSGVNFTAG
jgi:protocatechuate 3,4-dioxygenase beta subunit